MDLERIGNSPIGTLTPIQIPKSGGPLNGTEPYSAYIPDPLPQEPQLSLATLHAATEAATAVARLDETTSRLPNPDLITNIIILREARSTSSIEGTYAEYDEILQSGYLADDQMSVNQREINNVIRATQIGVLRIQSRPINRTLLGELQSILLERTRDHAYDTGDLRQRLVSVGGGSSNIKRSRLVPPPNGPILEEGFSDWEKWINLNPDIPIIVRVALGHYQFETLHPYNNGNGRLGRLVCLLQLIEHGLLRSPTLDISTWLDQNKDEYIEQLMDVSYTGDFNPWVTFFATGVKEQAEATLRTANSLLEFKETTIEKLRASGRRSGVAMQLVESLIGNPMVTVPQAATLTAKRYQTARAAIEVLVDEGVLVQHHNLQGVRLFLCEGVIDILTSATRQ